MSSTSPYKSKLFTFLNRQSIQWGNRLTQAARRLKITVEWGAQIAVYPLYLLVQSSRVATRQFAAAQAEKKRAIAAESSATETSIDLTTEIIALSVAPEQTQELQGIACDLIKKEIIFIDRHNQTVKPDQSQEALQKQISLHLGELNYQKRQQQQAALPIASPRILPPVQTQSPNLLPPVRWILQGLSWLEQSPVAIAIDLFGESRWHSAIMPPEIYTPQLFPPLPLQPILQPIDDRLVQLEQQFLSPDPTLELPPLQRFFQKVLKLVPDRPAPEENSPTVPKPTPWLTWTDLFKPDLFNKEKAQPPLPLDTTPESTAAIAQISAAPKPEPTPQTPIDPARFLEINRPAAILTVDPPSPTDITAQRTIPKELVTVTTEEPKTSLEAQPEWIETEALSVGYEQHFLERILKAVDQLMAWLENAISKLWSRFRA